MNKILSLEVDLYKDKVFDHLDLTPKQEEALAILCDSETKDFLFGGAAGGGKSWLGCLWLLLNCLAYPETKWFIGRKRLMDLRGGTVETFFKVCKHLHINPEETFKYNQVDHYFKFKNGSRIDLLELMYQPRDPLYERLGSLEFTGGWIEEGGEVDYAAYETLGTRIGRQLNDKYGILAKLFITCNPKKNWLYKYFYQPFKQGLLERSKKFLQSLLSDNNKIDSGYADRLNRITDKQRRERLLLGHWEYEDDPAQLMTFDAITDIFKNLHVAEGKKYITADIARLGDDKSRIVIWNGFRAERRVSFEKQRINITADEIRKLMTEYSIPASQVVVDEDGVGGGVVDILGCKGFVNNSKPLKGENYDNLKSQCYFKLSERINNAGLYVNSDNEEEKDFIIAELEQVKRKNPDGDGKQGVIPKDEVKKVLGRSPDYSDALMMREFFELAPKSGVISIYEI